MPFSLIQGRRTTRESVWDKHGLTSLAKRVVEIEEEGSAPIGSNRTIPAASRVILINVVLANGQRALHTFISREARWDE